MTKKLKHYFESYPQSEECFVTANGFIFHKKTDAEAHAAELPDRRVKEYTRDEVEKMEEPAELKAESEKPASKPGAGKEVKLKPDAEKGKIKE